MSHIRDNLSHMCHFVTHVGPEATTGIPSARPVSQKPYCSCDRKTLQHNPPGAPTGRVDPGLASPVLPERRPAYFMPTRFLFEKIFPAAGVGMLCACAGASRPRPCPVSGSRPPSASIHSLPSRNRANLFHFPNFTSFLREGFCPKKNPRGLKLPGGSQLWL